MTHPYQDPRRSVEQRASDLLAPHDARGEGGADARALADSLRGRRAPSAPGRLHRGHGPGGGEEGPAERPRPDLARPRQPRGRAARRRPRPQPAAEVPARGDPARHPRDLARGVPGGPHGPRRDDVPLGPRLRGDLEPRSRRARGARPSGARPAAWAATRAWPRSSTSPATCAGAAPRRPSARTPTSWASSARASSAGCRARSATSSPPSSTSPATPGARARATTARCTSAGASSTTSSCSRSRWR